VKKRQNACKIISDNSEMLVKYRRFQPNPSAFRTLPLRWQGERECKYKYEFGQHFGVTKRQSFGYCAVFSA